MGRVKSALRHDYKDGLSSARPRRPAVWFGAAGGLLLAGIIAVWLTSDKDTDVEATPAAAAAATGVTRIELALPPSSQPADGPTPTAAPDKQPIAATSPTAGKTTPAQTSPQPVVAAAAASAAVTTDMDTEPAAPVGELMRVTVKSGDTLDRLFRRNGLSVADLALMLRLKEARNGLAKILPGDNIEIRHEQDTVLELSRRMSEELTLNLVRHDDGYKAEFLAHPVERRVAYAQGKIATSLFEAGTESGLSQTLVMNLAGVFAWDVDFALDIRSGDSFALVYEEIWQDDVRLRDGEILAAEFVNQGRKVRALRYQDPDGRVDYYTPEGLSMRKAFLRTPVDFARVSSNFNPNRLHPVLKTRRPHRGVDYAARTGTPIKAAGDGKVIFRGRNGGYGNCVIIQHGGNITTLYAHMSRYDKNAPRGKRVRQGQVIGYVGATGLATAAHLHYEYRLNGVHRNPRTVPLPDAEPIPKQYRAMFEEASQPLIAQLDAITQTRLAAR